MAWRGQVSEGSWSAKISKGHEEVSWLWRVTRKGNTRLNHSFSRRSMMISNISYETTSSCSFFLSALTMSSHSWSVSLRTGVWSQPLIEQMKHEARQKLATLTRVISSGAMYSIPCSSISYSTVVARSLSRGSEGKTVLR